MFCVCFRLKLLQLLPVTDTTSFHDERDSYPYSSISVFALHPLFLRISAIPGLSLLIKAEADKETKRLNDPKYYKEAQVDEDLNTELYKPVDYPEVMRVKRNLTWKAYLELGNATLNSMDFQDWFERVRDFFSLFPYLFLSLFLFCSRFITAVQKIPGPELLMYL